MNIHINKTINEKLNNDEFKINIEVSDKNE